MKIKLFSIGSLLCILVLTSLLHAYDNHLFQDLRFKYKNNDLATCYEYSRNPAVFNIGIDQDYNLYCSNNGLLQNNYKRLFDPSMNRSYGISFFSNKILDRKSTLATAVVFDWSKHYEEYGSLEKYFYENYFSFTDSTTGNTTYYGPRLWILYKRDITDRLVSALQIEYGIERGLKDVYTECMTIYRNVDVKLGLAYHSSDGSFVSGIYGRIFDHQGKYEAVDDLLDAVNFTYIGYHVYRPENPRSSNNKSDWTTGYETGIHFRKNDLLLKGFGLRSALFLGATENTIKTGSSSQPVLIGYWIRKAVNLENRLSYRIEAIRSEIGLIYNYNETTDWAKHGQFEVNLLDYSSSTYDFSLDLKISPFRILTLKAGYNIGSGDIDYAEYTADFVFDEILEKSRLFIDWEIQLNRISNLYFGYENIVQEPLFYWGTPEFNIKNVYLAWDRLFVIGRIGFRIDIGVWDPSDSNKNIEYYGISLSFSK